MNGWHFLIAFFGLMLVEYVFSKARHYNYFDFKDSAINICFGIFDYSFNLLFSVASYWFFDLIFQRFALFHISNTWFTAAILFILVDFIGYWFHRLSHEVNFMWGAHIVHHQSEEYNLTVGIRTSIFIPVMNIIFLAVLPLAGFDPAACSIIFMVQGAYQLLLHTRLINKLGLLDKILMTPSNHRAHHGKNEVYIDKNFGNVLLIWDHLFHTYQPETEEVEFGVTTPPRSKDIAMATFEYWMHIVQCARGLNRKETARLIFGRPGELCIGGEAEEYTEEDEPVLRAIRLYIVSQIGVMALLLWGCLSAGPVSYVDYGQLFIMCGACCFSCSAMTEYKRWAFGFEYLRLHYTAIFTIITLNHARFIDFRGMLILSVSGLFILLVNRIRAKLDNE